MNSWTLIKLEAFFDTWYSIANGFGLQVRRDHWSRASIEVEMALVRKTLLIQRGTNLQSNANNVDVKDSSQIELHMGGFSKSVSP